MHELLVIRFRGLGKASTVLSELLQLTYDAKLDLFDAVAAYRTDDGVLRIDDSVQTTSKEAARWGAIFGGVLGATIAGPFTVGLSLAAAAAMATAGALGGLRRYGGELIRTDLQPEALQLDQKAGGA